MTDEVFLLDLDYQGKLDSDEYRERFIRVNQAVVRSGWVCLMGALFCTLPISTIMFFGCYFSEDPDWTWYVFAVVITCSPFWVAMLFLYSRTLWARAAVRRLGRDGHLVIGHIVNCVRTIYNQNDEDLPSYYVVEVTYEAQTPGGVTVTGKKGLPRDDLMNAPLPPVGTPVAVLVLNQKNHSLL